MQLTYGGKVNQSLLSFKSPQEFSLNVKKMHYSNEAGISEIYQRDFNSTCRR